MGMLKIGALWEKESENTGTYFSGQMDLPVEIILKPGTRFILFKNKSEHEKSPIFDVFVDESKLGNGKPKEKAESSFDNDEIPF